MCTTASVTVPAPRNISFTSLASIVLGSLQTSTLPTSSSCRPFEALGPSPPAAPPPLPSAGAPLFLFLWRFWCTLIFTCLPLNFLPFASLSARLPSSTDAKSTWQDFWKKVTLSIWRPVKNSLTSPSMVPLGRPTIMRESPISFLPGFRFTRTSTWIMYPTSPSSSPSPSTWISLPLVLSSAELASSTE